MDLLRSLGVVAVTLASACVPDLDVDESLVTAPRLLAVSAEPGEGIALERSRYRALWVGPEGPIPDAELTFAHCIARKPLAELGAVSQECLQAEGAGVVTFGTGLTAQGTVPADVCSLFGPISPASATGDSPGRPVDADTTGGYSLPVRITTPDGRYVFFEQRVRCDLATATQAQSADFARRYKRNANPIVQTVELEHDDGRVDTIDDDADVTVTRGETVTLRVAWPVCPASDDALCGDGICNGDETRQSCREDCIVERGCGGAESYVYFDPIAREVVDRREAFRVAWFTTAGSLATERTGVAEGDDNNTSANASDNRWTAPNATGDVNLWVVLRDSRGGVGWQQLSLRVTE